jgi:hypothetical protein
MSRPRKDLPSHLCSLLARIPRGVHADLRALCVREDRVVSDVVTEACMLLVASRALQSSSGNKGDA